MEIIQNDTSRPSSPEILDRTNRSDEGQNSLLSREDRSHVREPLSHNEEGKPLAAEATIGECCPSTKLKRSSYITWLVLIYGSFAGASWILICLLTSHPLTVGQYTFDYREPGRHAGYRAETLHSKYVQSERVYTIARAMQSIVGLVTIPLTSAVCSAAAVVFAQSNTKRQNLSMRQLMTLADKGWSDPTTIGKLLIGKGAKLSSSFLIAALLLTTFGAVITPLQAIFVSQRTIKTPTEVSFLDYVLDIPDQFTQGDFYGNDDTIKDNNLAVTEARSAFSSTSNDDPQPRLWHGSHACKNSNDTDDSVVPCSQGASKLGNFSELIDPYLTQLPVGYSTGLIRQYIPRFNSSVAWEIIPDEAMPTGCDKMPHSFFAHYANSTWPPEEYWNLLDGAPKNWSVQACMPADESVSPWKSTRLRQDFTEVLYLNISVMGYEWIRDRTGSLASGGIAKITSNTTAGYFELPNYMNGEKAGPIIEESPFDLCGNDCEAQGWPRQNIAARSVDVDANLETEGSKSLGTVVNKGPLLIVAMALFGHGSFLSARLTDPETFLTNATKDPKTGSWPDYANACTEQAPLIRLFSNPEADTSSECIQDNLLTMRDLDFEIARYIDNFWYDSTPETVERRTNAFRSAVFLATEAWLTTSNANPTLKVFYDMGADTSVPTISLAGTIVISVLLGTYLISLTALALYSYETPRWTKTLDSFAMMRIGAAIHEQIPLDFSLDTKKIAALDEMSGVLGDATGGDGDVGVLGFGAATPLNGVRNYRCYPGYAPPQKRRPYHLVRDGDRVYRIMDQPVSRRAPSQEVMSQQIPLSPGANSTS